MKKFLSISPFEASQTQRGSVITEFLFIAPVVVSLVFVCMNINELYEDRILLQISSRNTASLADAPLSEKVESIVQDLNIGIPISLGLDQAVVENQNTVRYRGYVISISSDLKANTQKDFKTIETVYAGDRSSSYQDISRIIGYGTSYGVQVIDTVRTLGGALDSIPLFVPDIPSTQHFLVTVDESASLFSKALLTTFSFVERTSSGAQTAYKTVKLSNQFVSRYMGGFHSSDYQYQGAAGYALGQINKLSHWSKPYKLEDGWQSGGGLFGGRIEKGFVANCMMNFIADSKCKGPTAHSSTIRLVGIVKGIVQVIANYFSGGSAEEANELSKVFVDESLDMLSDEIGQKMVDEMTSKITEKGSEYLDKTLSNAIDGVKTRIETSINDGFQRQSGALNAH